MRSGPGLIKTGTLPESGLDYSKSAQMQEILERYLRLRNKNAELFNRITHESMTEQETAKLVRQFHQVIDELAKNAEMLSSLNNGRDVKPMIDDFLARTGGRTEFERMRDWMMKQREKQTQHPQSPTRGI